MKTLKLSFTNGDGETIKHTAILTDDLTDLSKSKRNQADDIVDVDDETWVVAIYSGNQVIEYEFKSEFYQRTLEPSRVLVWDINPTNGNEGLEGEYEFNLN